MNKYSMYFNEQMTEMEARSGFFAAINNRTKEEIAEIKKEYYEVMKIIDARYLALVQQGLDYME